MKRAIVKTLLVITAISSLSIGATVGCSTQPKEEQEDLSIVNALQGEWINGLATLKFEGKNATWHNGDPSNKDTIRIYVGNVTDSKGVKWAKYQRTIDSECYRYDGDKVYNIDFRFLNNGLSTEYTRKTATP